MPPPNNSVNLYLVQVYVDDDAADAECPDWTLPVMAPSVEQATAIAADEMADLYPHRFDTESLRYEVDAYVPQSDTGILAPAN